MELVILFGPPAVGKMTVGYELCKLTGFKLLHNHMTVEPLVEVFEFGSPPFLRLVGEFRRRIIEEAFDTDLPGLVLTLVWGLDLEADTELVESYFTLAASRGGRVRLVELYSDQEERLRRNATEFRLDRKRTHRNRDLSERILTDLDRDHVLNSGGPVPAPGEALLSEHGFLRIDNNRLSAPETATRIAAHFGF
jgi:hypothetical protein